MVKRFQKLGGRIAPAIFVNATSDGAFAARTVSSPVDSDSSDGNEPHAVRELPVGLEMVLCVCHDGETRSQVCHQAMLTIKSRMQGKQGAGVEMIPPLGILTGIDPFVSPTMTYAQFLTTDTPDFERETAWGFREMTVSRSGPPDSLFVSAFGNTRVPRLGEAASPTVCT